MPADAGDKTEAPTPRRLDDARKDGQVAKSTDFAAAAGLLAGLLLLRGFGPGVIKGCSELMANALALDNTYVNAMAMMEHSWPMVLHSIAAMLLPFLLVFVVVAIVANLLQVGFLFSLKPVTPSFEKISPLKGLQRLFSLKTAVRMAMNLSKVGIIALVAYYTIRGYMPELIGIAGLSLNEVAGCGADLVFSLGIRLAVILMILALLDYAYQKWQHTKDLRMSKEEVKEEMKRMEGDPIMRQRRRGVARQLAAQRMSQAVPKADVVITNPTELAIALKYDHAEMSAPKVVAKGAGFIARRIRQIAIENDVPIVERKPLAQALYKACEVGDHVPPELYKAVAEVLAYVFELAGKGFRRVAAV